MFKEKDYDEEKVREVIYFQGVHGRIIKVGEEDLDIDFNLADKWLTPRYQGAVAILNALGLDEEYLDNLDIGDVVEFHDVSVG